MLSLARRHSGKIFLRRTNYNRLTILYAAPSMVFRVELRRVTQRDRGRAYNTTLSFWPQNGTIEFMAEVRRPLIPQFTLRWILALTTVMAVVSLVVNQALVGHAWAVG